MREEVLCMERVSYQEQGIVQLDDFNLRIFSGEIMGLLPVNNHGLTAFLQLLQYNTALNYGYVYYRGEQVNSWRNTTHKRNRVGLIQSESCLVGGLTVADNIFVLRPGFKAWYIRPSVLRKQLIPFLKSIDIHISADAYVEELNAFERTVVDILKSVVAGCRLIVLRDISSFLSEQELKKIRRLLEFYSEQGFSFLYIDFHFEELQHVCSRVALMSNGRIIKILQSSETTPAVFNHYTRVYSSKVKEELIRTVQAREESPQVFEIKNLRGETIHDLSFSMSAGECIVLQDMDNQILSELLAILIGDAAPREGEILVGGSALTAENSRDVAVIQELPSRSMLFSELSYLDNLCFSVDHRLSEVWSSRSVREGIRDEYSAVIGREIFDKRVDRLSEKQKYELIYYRIAIQRPKVVFCVQPFRRADIELRMHIWDLLKMLIDKGIAIVILSVNLADSLSLADQLIRIEKGRMRQKYLSRDFSDMPIHAPWIDLYQEVRANSDT